ncbi:sugar ABC transporter ATP-binding protein [Castellaniella caeni]|uniref:sugar ABC transporter ATP-binding protein n=1 Tax=Castellaniella caeni TaxID=266123 RepID=UPI000C9EDD21|nr:sugar ABC transporter ATP-binding protein [Castellaniella caeni]
MNQTYATAPTHVPGPSVPALRLLDLSMDFGPVKALSGVSLEVRRGSVHALLGENGAGKSTTVKLLSGVMRPTHGRIEVDGRAVVLRSPLQARAQGIQTAFQELTLLPDLSVFDNMLMPRPPIHVSGLIRRREQRRAIGRHFDELELGIDLDVPVREFNLAQQQKIEIARAIYHQPRILLLDEPTSALPPTDVQWLGHLIARLRRQQVTIIFISHRMEEVEAFCDDLTVLRNGRHVASRPARDFTRDEVVELIVGRSLSKVFPERKRPAQAKPVLALKAASTSVIHDASFTLNQGEILGVAALQGMGQLDLFRLCFGLVQPRAGHLELDAWPQRLLGPRDAIQRGIGFVPEDRKHGGLLLNQTGLQNAALPVLNAMTKWGILRRARELSAGARAFERLQLDRRALWTDAGAFSGGNQQKIVLAKWLMARSRILLLFDPTRGIDVGTKQEIYQLMADYAQLGGAILFYSTEIPEVIHMSHRVLTVYKGRINALIEGDDISEARVMRHVMGQADGVAEGDDD